MPFFSVLPSTAQIGLRVNSAHFHPDQIRRGKRRSKRNVETTVSIKINRSLFAWPKSFFMCDEHGNLRSILAAIKDLRRDIIIRGKSDFRFSKEGTSSGRQIIMINSAWAAKAGERVKCFGIGLFP